MRTTHNQLTLTIQLILYIFKFASTVSHVLSKKTKKKKKKFCEFFSSGKLGGHPNQTCTLHYNLSHMFYSCSSKCPWNETEQLTIQSVNNNSQTRSVQLHSFDQSWYPHHIRIWEEADSLLIKMRFKCLHSKSTCPFLFFATVFFFIKYRPLHEQMIFSTSDLLQGRWAMKYFILKSCST